MLCGFLSIILSIKGNFYLASWLIIIAAVLDVLDGSIARWINVASDFGKELDSLSDLVSFAGAPVFLFYSLNKTGLLKLAVLFFFFWCGAFRLARFNLSSRKKEENVFYGLPTTAAGGFWAAYILATLKYKFLISPSIEAIVMFVLAILMVSNIIYPKYRDIHWTKGIIFLVIVSVFLAVYLKLTILSIFLLYIVVSPFSRKTA